MNNKRYSAKKELYANCIETRANTNYVFMTYSEWTKENLLYNQSRIEHLFRYYYEGNSFETLLEYKESGLKEFNLSVGSASPHLTQGSLNL